MFRDLIRGALETAQAAAGEPTTYSRGSLSVQLTVLPGQVGWNADPTRGLVVESDDADWLIPAGQLVLNGQPTLPQTNDRLTIVRDGVTQVFQVLPNDGQPYRLDATQSLLRIHTKRRS
jgi:hypothetical protein